MIPWNSGPGIKMATWDSLHHPQSTYLLAISFADFKLEVSVQEACTSTAYTNALLPAVLFTSSRWV
jgi:hypothetical protein